MKKAFITDEIFEDRPISKKVVDKLLNNRIGEIFKFNQFQKILIKKPKYIVLFGGRRK